MSENKYYGINVKYVSSTYFVSVRNPTGFDMGSNPKWDRKTNGEPVTVTALSRIDGDPSEFYKVRYHNLVDNFLIGDLEKAIVEIDQPKKE